MFNRAKVPIGTPDFSEGSQGRIRIMIPAQSVTLPSSPTRVILPSATVSHDDVAEPQKKQTLSWALACCLAWVIQSALCWTTGYRDQALQGAIEKGVQEIEARERLNYDQNLISAKRESQRGTAPFWRMLWQINDFGLEPTAFLFRLWAIPMAVSATVLVCGRWIPPEEIRPEVSRWIWPATLRPGIELLTAIGHSGHQSPLGLNLFLPSGNYQIGPYMALGQLDLFWLASIFLMCWSIRRNHHIKFRHLLAGVFSVTVVEWLLRVSIALVVGAGIRETLIPTEPFRVGRGPGP